MVGKKQNIKDLILFISKGIAVITLMLASYIIMCITTNPAHAQTILNMRSTTAVPSPVSLTAPPPNTAGWFDSTTIAALIGLGGVILGALAGTITTIYQTRRNERFQKELARQNEQLQQEIQRQNMQMLRMQKELELEYALKTQQEQRKNIEDEDRRKKMQSLQDNDQRAQVYRDMLIVDPRIAFVHILDMKRPLVLKDIYVRLHVYQEARPPRSTNLDTTYANVMPISTQMVQSIEYLHIPSQIIQVEMQQQEMRLQASLNPEEAIRLYRRCVIVGDPGAGKTTLLKYLALASVESYLSGLPDLPVYVELNAFVSSGLHDLIDYIAIVWESFYAFPQDEARIYITEQLQQGKALLLLDALDETLLGTTLEAAESSYAMASKAILQLAIRYPKAPIVVTARKAGYRQRAPLVGFTELEVLDFRPEDIRQFIVNWYSSSQDVFKDKKVNDLLVCLKQHSRIQILATNPLLLSLIILVYESQLDLPDRRSDLYRRCIDILLVN